jgi:antitoxin PrlF
MVNAGLRGEANTGVVIALCPVPYYTARSKDKVRTMTTDATLTSKGQTTIPKEIRDSLGLQPGDRMIFTLMPDGTVVLRVKTKSVMDLAGLLRKKGRKPVAIARLSR